MRNSHPQIFDRLASQLLVIGVNHKVAPVEVRERLAFKPDNIPEVLRTLVRENTFTSNNSKPETQSDTRDGLPLEAVLVSTCNRSELYLYAVNFNTETPENFRHVRQQLHMCGLNFLALHANMSKSSLKKITYVYAGKKAAHHLMRVAAGLDSLVLGENEILGQVREAAELAQKADACGPYLNALFRYAIQAGKCVRSETEIGRARLSVASVVVDLAEQTLGNISHRTVLLVGAGKISSMTGCALVNAGLHCVLVANRTYERAQKLAEKLNYISPIEQSAQAVHFDALQEHLKTADIVICSTGAPHIVLHLPVIARAMDERHGRPLLIADLAVPRDVEPAVAELPGITLVNIDDLEDLAKNLHPLTKAVFEAAESIVTQTLEEFCVWHAARRCAPLIRALQEKAQAICQAEIQRTLPRLGELNSKQQAALEAMAQSIINRLLHDPIMHLKDPCIDTLVDPENLAKNGTTEEYAAWFERLFSLRVG